MSCHGAFREKTSASALIHEEDSGEAKGESSSGVGQSLRSWAEAGARQWRNAPADTATARRSSLVAKVTITYCRVITQTTVCVCECVRV